MQNFENVTIVKDSCNQLFIRAENNGLIPLLTQNGEMIFAGVHPPQIDINEYFLRKKD